MRCPDKDGELLINTLIRTGLRSVLKWIRTGLKSVLKWIRTGAGAVLIDLFEELGGKGSALDGDVSQQLLLVSLLQNILLHCPLRHQPGWAGHGGVTSSHTECFVTCRECFCQLLGEGDLKVQPPHSMTWVCAQLEATYCPLHVKLNEVTRQRQAHHPGQLLFSRECNCNQVLALASSLSF